MYAPSLGSLGLSVNRITATLSDLNQIEAADKQLKATRQFLEDQAAEREQERDEFVKEIERLRGAIREKDKERVNFERTTKEVSASWWWVL